MPNRRNRPPPVKKRTAPLVTASASSSTVVEDGHVRPERKLTAKTTKEISAEVARELAPLEIDGGFRFDTGMGPDHPRACHQVRARG